MKPRLLLSPISNQVYIVTRYKEIGKGYFKAITKYDCTEEFNAIVKTFKERGDSVERK